jgi:hypothetical protein
MYWTVNPINAFVGVGADQCVLTSGTSEPVEAGGGNGMPRNLLHSKLSLSSNKRRRSGMERFRAASREPDMMAVVSKSVTENVTPYWHTWLWFQRSSGHCGKDTGPLQPGAF